MFFYLVSFFVSVRRVSSKTDAPTGALPPELRWQSGRLLTDRSLVRSQVVASLTFYFLTFLFFSPQRSDPLRNFEFPRLKYCQRVVRKPCSAEVSSDRTNLSPFTKDYRGLAFQCDFKVFVARESTFNKNKKQKPPARIIYFPVVLVCRAACCRVASATGSTPAYL